MTFLSTKTHNITKSKLKPWAHVVVSSIHPWHSPDYFTAVLAEKTQMFFLLPPPKKYKNVIVKLMNSQIDICMRIIISSVRFHWMRAVVMMCVKKAAVWLTACWTLMFCFLIYAPVNPAYGLWFLMFFLVKY